MSGPGARRGKGEVMNREVKGEMADYDSALNTFEPFTDTMDTTPTRYITLDPLVDQFELTEVSHYMDCTNAVTYQILLLQAAEADNVESRSKIIWDSGDSKADDTPYKSMAGNGKLPASVNCEDKGRLYMLQIWSGDPGATSGFIKVKGIALGD
jgi:hypothetical protein